MTRRVAALAALLLALPVAASRDVSGTYSLYTPGNPVVSGTTISISWANNTLTDIATALTDSLSRSGSGGMSAALKLVVGSAAAPALYFAGDTASGLYAATTSDVGMSIAGTRIMRWLAGGVSVAGTLSVSGATSLGATSLSGALSVSTGGASITGNVSVVGTVSATSTASFVTSIKLTGPAGGSWSLAAPTITAAQNYTLSLPTALPASTLPLMMSSTGAMSVTSISTAHVADSAITTALLADGAVTTAKLASSTVTCTGTTSYSRAVTTTVWADVNDGGGNPVQVTISASGVRPVHVFLKWNGSGTSGAYVATATGNVAYLSLYDATAGAYITMVNASATNAITMPVSLGAMYVPPVSGGRTFKLRARTNSSNITVYDVDICAVEL